MNPPSFIEAAPITAAPGQSAPAPTTGCGLSEAALACCALAGWGNPLSGLDAQAEYVTGLIHRVKATHTTSQIAAWQTRLTISPSQWGIRWRWARRVIHQHLPHLQGTEELPETPDDLDLPQEPVP